MCILSVMTKLGFAQGKSSPCIYYHQGRGLRVWVYGDDFVVMGSYTDTKWLEAKLREAWTLTVRGIMGPPGYKDCVQELRVLGRLISWTAEGITWEADPRHAEIVCKSYGLRAGADTSASTSASPKAMRKITTPGVSDKQEELENEVPLDIAQRALYRSMTMRTQYLTQDRPELQFQGRERARRMQEPTNLDETALKRMARFMDGAPRVVWLFPWQKQVRHLDTWCDSNHAGCLRTRKSVSGGAVMIGTATCHTYSKSQAVIALSSGEAEYYGLVSAVSTSFGVQSALKDWGWKLGVRVMMDASTGIAIGSRRGLGKVKHIDTVFLWVQQHVTDGRVKLEKRPTGEMLADFLTKNADTKMMQMCMRGLNVHFREGRSGLALHS
jgi:hypothetical protein